MLEFQEKKRLKKVLYSKPLTLLLLVVGFALGNVVWNMFETYRDAKENANLASEKVVELNLRKVELEQKIAKLETPRGKEEALREKYLVAKEGEKVIVLVDDTKSTQPTSSLEKRAFWAGCQTKVEMSYLLQSRNVILD